MKYVLIPLLLLLLCCVQTTAQDTSATVYFDYKWKKTTYGNACYYRKTVWKDDQLHLFDYYMNGQLQMTGQYEDKAATIKTDTFLFYHRNGNLKYQRTYSHGELFGKWMGWFDDGKKDYVCTFKENNYKCVYYHANGLVSSIEEFKDTTLVNAQLWDSTGEVSSNRYLLIEPSLEGYNDGYKEYFSKKMYFPDDAVGNKESETIEFYFIIDKTGKAIWGDVIGFSDPSIALPLQNIVENMPLWSPAIIHNRPVDYEYYFTYTFKR